MNTKLFAMTAVAIMLVAPFALVNTEKTEEDDAVLGTIAVSLLIGAGIGGIAGWFANDLWGSDGDEQTMEHLRLASANNIHDVASVATAFTTNANTNYAQLWGMTKEHWIRQAEVQSYVQWNNADSVYDSSSILVGSDLLNNAAIMTANSVAQIGSFFNELSIKISNWSANDVYSGKMSAGFVMDNVRVMSGTSMNAKLVSVASGSGKVYIGVIDDYFVAGNDSDMTESGKSNYVPGYIYNPGSSTTITSDGGLVYNVPSGLVYLKDLYSTVGHKSFTQGIYTMGGTLASDSFASVISDRVALKSGLIIDKEDNISLAVLDGDRVSYKSGSYGGLYFKVEASDIPDGSRNPDSVDMMPLLKAYQLLIDRLYWTTVSANNAGNAVWDIYKEANEKNYAVTTLMNSNVYDSVVLSSAMNEVMTLSAMQQLATYYDGHEEDLTDLEIGLYSDGMNAPFVRGSITDKNGLTIYDDVIFTPFFQTDDVTLERGTQYTVKQSTFVAVWHDGAELSSWYNSGMDAKDYETLLIDEGYVFNITQLGQCDDDGMHNESKIEFKVTKIRYIQPKDTDLTKDIEFQRTAKNVLQIVCLIAGFLSLAYGVFRREPLAIGIGIALVVFAVVFAEPVWEWITGLKGILPW